MLRHPLSFVVAALAPAAIAVAQAQWTLLQPPTSPTGRNGASLAFDPGAQRSFLTWGQTSGGMGDMQMWDGATWTPCTVTATAFLWPRRDCGFVHESSGALLLFGGWRPGFGIGGGQPMVLDETWRVGTTASGALHFALLAPVARPAARQGVAMVRTNQGVLLFGGCTLNRGIVFGDTWQWNGTTWTQLASGPAARAYAALTFDAGRNVAVLFGGFDGSGQGLADTWEFDGATWQQKAVSPSPTGRGGATFVWSPAASRALLFGGSASHATGPNLGDAWAWNGTQWIGQPTVGAPATNSLAAATWEPMAQRVLTFGGLAAGVANQTHHVDLLPPSASYTPFGTGCLGPNGQVPRLTAAANELPAIGTTSHLVVDQLPAALALTVFVLGFSNTWEASAGYALPLDLGVVGWPGCDQLVSTEVMVAVPTLTGEADYALTWPMNAGLAGFTYYAQALVVYVPTGAAVSNALTGVVGY